jgi:hypothetical protein
MTPLMRRSVLPVWLSSHICLAEPLNDPPVSARHVLDDDGMEQPFERPIADLRERTLWQVAADNHGIRALLLPHVHGRGCS